MPFTIRLRVAGIISLAIICAALSALAGFTCAVHLAHHRPDPASYAFVACLLSLAFAFLFCYLADCYERDARSIGGYLRRRKRSEARLRARLHLT